LADGIINDWGKKGSIGHGGLLLAFSVIEENGVLSLMVNA
jgi:hypothetical protein